MQITLADFIKANSIRLTAERVDTNPHMEDSGNMDHWKVVLKAGRAQMTVYFSKGYGHHGAEPEADEVLDCLASDASSVENAGSFEGWASEFGYDTDSRKAERTYRIIEQQASKLEKLLGESAYKTLIWNTERL